MARRRAYAAASPAPPVRMPVADAAGTVLAEPLYARAAMPGFDTAAMDGYALGSPGRCRVIGTILAGDAPGSIALRPGEAVRIATGAPVPSGALHVVRQEDALLDGDMVQGPALAAGTHIRSLGEDAAAGELLAPSGARVSAAAVGLAAASGHTDLLVVPRPAVAAIVSGDEVFTGRAAPSAGQLRDAIGPMLPALVAGLGGRLSGAAHVPDRPREQLSAAIDAAGRDGAAVVVVSGATSVGPADGLRAVLRDGAAELVVDSVACRPGHPQLLARLRRPSGDLWLVGLPGNPFAALVAMHTLAAPLLARLAGRVMPALPTVVPSGIGAQQRSGGTTLVPVSWDGAAVGGAMARRPASLRAAACADALAAIPAGWAPGQPVPAMPLDPGLLR